MTLLSPYRILDLTDVRGQIAGMMLGDLGADVVRVEPPGGSAARRVGPFLPEADAAPAERSLAFAAYNRNKRSVELDLDDPAGRQSFVELVRGADFVLDSGPPSLLDEAGFGFERLLEINPTIVHVRTTPFGSDGPMADQPAADLTIAALGGPVGLQGEPDRDPLRLSVPQVWRHAGAEAALAALIGHARMRTTGRGVFVDVSAQAAMVWTMLNASEAWAIHGRNYERAGAQLQVGAVGLNLAHPCQDGHLIALTSGGMFRALEPAMREAGTLEDGFSEREDWTTYDMRVFGRGELAISFEELSGVFDRFFETRTKRALFALGLEVGQTIAPVQTIDDLLEFEQLRIREFFHGLELANGVRVKAPGPFARSSAFDFEIRRPAPRLGEHTEEILAELAREPRSRVALHADGVHGDDAGAARRELPLTGLKVADFSWIGVGPISAKYLADHGADVIRIESETRGDGLRASGPFKDDQPGWNRSHFYGEFNTSKRGLALDLKHERAAEVLPRLLGWADVVLESFTPGAAARLGVSYENARAANPGVIMVSTCLMGQTGPVASLAGYGYHAAAIAGFTALTGYPDRPPVGPWNAYTDTIAPRFLATTLLAAIDHRRRTGEGQYIDLAQMEAALHFLTPEILARQATGERFERAGNRSRDAAPQGVHPCAGDDEWCAIAVENDVQWQALCRALKRTDWAERADLAGAAGRIAAHDELDVEIGRWTRERAPRDVMQTLLDAGVPAGHVQRSRDLLVDPQLAHRRFHRELEHAEMGRVPYAGHQFRVSGYDNGPRHAAPLIGGESFEILTRDLGLDAELVAELMASGVIH
jgi:crotonobetainyl-CoA:carnitine CoA-transferase CaiB-like acyl-CoA transferase